MRVFTFSLQFTYRYLFTTISFSLRCPGNKAKVDFNFNNYSTNHQVLSAVDRIKYLRENTNTTGGLKVTRLEVFGGNYRRRPNVEQLIILITDGVPTYDSDKLDAEVAAIKRKGIRIVGLGVTNKVIIDVFLIFTTIVEASLLHSFTPGLKPTF